ncbi:transposase family protein, partial [Micromonospora sp. DT47]|uniref:transposase family protein n=1 Tax=Micromonospora sp. DT47 TaxID=3393431 RepID=UPI003CE9FD6A
SVRTPFKRHRYRPKLSHRQRAVNRTHSRIRALGERAIATLKTWKILTKLHYCPRRTTAIMQAILVLHRVDMGHLRRLGVVG